MSSAAKPQGTTELLLLVLGGVMFLSLILRKRQRTGTAEIGDVQVVDWNAKPDYDPVSYPSKPIF